MADHDLDHRPAPTSTPARVVFACVRNAGRSQMAAAFFNALADPDRATAVSAGTDPATEVHPEVRTVMAEAGLDLRRSTPQRLTVDLADGAALLITMGCGDACPYIPGAELDDWPLADPHGRPLDEVRTIRDEIQRRVTALLQARGWMAAAPPRARASRHADS